MKNMTLTATLLALTCVTSASAQKVTLEFWSMWNPNEPAAKVLQQAAADYQAAHPDVKVNFNFAGRDVRKLVIPALTSGKTVDIVENGIDWLTAGATPNYWLPLNKYLTRPLTDDEAAHRPDDSDVLHGLQKKRRAEQFLIVLQAHELSV